MVTTENVYLYSMKKGRKAKKGVIGGSICVLCPCCAYIHVLFVPVAGAMLEHGIPGMWPSKPNFSRGKEQTPAYTPSDILAEVRS